MGRQKILNRVVVSISKFDLLFVSLLLFLSDILIFEGFISYVL